MKPMRWITTVMMLLIAFGAAAQEEFFDDVYFSTPSKSKSEKAEKKEVVEELLKKFGVKLENDKGYDCVYVANMAKADYFKSSITDEAHLALFIKDYIDDPDGYEGLPFTRFYADCIGSGTPILWEQML